MLDPEAESAPSEPINLPGSDNDPASFRTVPWKIRDILIGISVPLAIEVATLTLKPEWMSLGLRIAFVTLAIALYFWLVGFPILLARRRLPGFSIRLPSLGRLAPEVLLMGPLLIGLWSVVSMALVLWSLVSPVRPHNILEGASDFGLTPSLVLILIGAFTLVPIGEELYMRGFLYNGLRRFLPVPAALVAQAAVFGLMHPYNVAYVVVTFFMGLYLGLIYEWRKTLVMPIGVHALQNFFVSVVTLVTIFQGSAAPVLGVRGDRNSEGFVVREVIPGTTAESIGIQPGDVLLSFDGQPITGIEDLRDAMRRHQAGDRVPIQVEREGQKLDLTGELRARPAWRN